MESVPDSEAMRVVRWKQNVPCKDSNHLLCRDVVLVRIS